MKESRIVYTSRERKHKKSFSRRKAIFISALFLLFSVSGGVVYLLRLPQWQVENIFIEGLETLPEEEVVEKASQFLEGSYVYLIPKRSIAAAPVEQLEHFLKKEFLIISSINIDREYPDTLKIYIKERKLWAIYCNDLDTSADQRGLNPAPEQAQYGAGADQRGQISTQTGVDTNVNRQDIEEECAYVDETGFAYEKAPSSSGALILRIRSDEESVKVASQVIPLEKMAKMRTLGETLNQKLNIRTVGYELFSKIPREVRVVTEEGFKIWLKLDGNIEKMTKVLKTVLDEKIGDRRPEIEYIDSRFENKVFYKLR